MPIDPSIPLQIRVPQSVNPLNAIGQALELRQQMQGQRIQDEQLKQAQMNRERDLQEEEVIHSAFEKYGGDPSKALPEIATGVRAKTYMDLRKSVDEERKSAAQIAKDDAQTGEAKLKIKQAQNEQLAGITGFALDLPDDELSKQWGNLAASAKAVDPELQIPDQPLSKADLRTLRTRFLTGAALSKEQLDKADLDKKQKDAITAGVGARIAVATEGNKIAEAASDATIKANQAITGAPDPTTGLTKIQQADLDEKKADNLRADAAAALAAKKAAETERHNRENELRMAKIAAGTGNTLPELANTPKAMQAPAAAAYSRSSIAYADAKAAAEEIQSVIDLVKSGNKAAGSNLPLLGVGSLNAINGIKRMNKAEIDQYQGAGSLWDRITGKAGNLAAGQPIPADVLADIEQLHRTLADGSLRKYKGEVDAINKSHGSSFKVQGPMIRARDEKGILHEAEEGTQLPPGWKLEQ